MGSKFFLCFKYIDFFVLRQRDGRYLKLPLTRIQNLELTYWFRQLAVVVGWWRKEAINWRAQGGGVEDGVAEAVGQPTDEIFAYADGIADEMVNLPVREIGEE